MAATVKPGGPCPSVPLTRACTWIRPILVRNVRAVSSVPVIRANPVARDRIDPGDALILLQDRQYLLRTRGAVEAEPGVDRPGEVVRVGVGEGECGGGAPGQRYAFEAVEDRAVPGPPERMRDGG